MRYIVYVKENNEWKKLKTFKDEMPAKAFKRALERDKKEAKIEVN